jgi:hypothetical protein
LRLLTCEHVTGGGFVDSSLPPSLALAGDMMPGRLVKDVAPFDDIDIVLVRDTRLERPLGLGPRRVDIGALDAA